jgi:hypothetical protein
MLSLLREMIRAPLRDTEGKRCADWNEEKNGSQHSRYDLCKRRLGAHDSISQYWRRQ